MDTNDYRLRVTFQNIINAIACSGGVRASDVAPAAHRAKIAPGTPAAPGAGAAAGTVAAPGAAATPSAECSRLASQAETLQPPAGLSLSLARGVFAALLERRLQRINAQLIVPWGFKPGCSPFYCFIQAVLQPLIPRALDLMREKHDLLHPGQPFPDALLRAHLVELLMPVWDDVAKAIVCFVHVAPRA